jgi:hypothetical protein
MLQALATPADLLLLSFQDIMHGNLLRTPVHVHPHHRCIAAVVVFGIPLSTTHSTTHSTTCTAQHKLHTERGRKGRFYLLYLLTCAFQYRYIYNNSCEPSQAIAGGLM